MKEPPASAFQAPTALSPASATARSARPSRLKSPAATDTGWLPAAKSVRERTPAPLLRYTETELPPRFATATSPSPSPSKSAAASATGWFPAA